MGLVTVHLWCVYHSGIFQATQANSAWPSPNGRLGAICVLAIVSANAGKETANAALQWALLPGALAY